MPSRPVRRPRKSDSRLTRQPVNIHQAKTQFSKLLQRVAHGETITIARHNVPIACLGPLPKARRWGTARGQFTLPDDFDAPLPEFEAQFYGEDRSKR